MHTFVWPFLVRKSVCDDISNPAPFMLSCGFGRNRSELSLVGTQRMEAVAMDMSRCISAPLGA